LIVLFSQLIVPTLNYHHLRYFRAIAREGSLVRAAAQLHVSPSSLSIQLRELEARLAHPLFLRAGRRLELTEAGRVALEYAETIFRAGDELVSTLQGRQPDRGRILRVGSVATLSRNFQLVLLRRLIRRRGVELVLHSGSLRELLAQLAAHAVDIVLANVAPPGDVHSGWRCHLLDRQPVSLVARPAAGAGRMRFPDGLDGARLVLPGRTSALRADFDVLLDRLGVRPAIVAEVDDMAMLRLLARETTATTLVPPVVVRDELRTRQLVERCRVPGIHEHFYAIVPERRFANPLVREVLDAAAGRSA